MDQTHLVSGMNVQRVDDSRNVSQDGQQNVDEQVCTTSSLKKDTNRWQDDGEDDFDNVARRMSA